MSYDSIMKLFDEDLPIPKLYFDWTLKMLYKSLEKLRKLSRIFPELSKQEFQARTIIILYQVILSSISHEIQIFRR